MVICEPYIVGLEFVHWYFSGCLAAKHAGLFISSADHVKRTLNIINLGGDNSTAKKKIVLLRISICSGNYFFSGKWHRKGREKIGKNMAAQDGKEVHPPVPYVMAPEATAPSFCGLAVMPDGDSKIICLEDSDFEEKYVVLIFYAGDWTSVCPTEIASYSDRKLDFEDLDSTIVFCSTDSHFSHSAWRNTPRGIGGVGKVEYPILADRNHAIAKAFGVVKKGEGVSYRANFIIDKKKVVRQILINPLAVGRHVDDTLRSIQAIQYHDETGNKVPASWTFSVALPDLADNHSEEEDDEGSEIPLKQEPP